MEMKLRPSFGSRQLPDNSGCQPAAKGLKARLVRWISATTVPP